MALINVTEELVNNVFRQEYLGNNLLACDCQQCQDDIVAYVLNRVKSRYVSTNRGEAYVKAQYFDPQIQSDLLRELTIAAQAVAEKPNHDKLA